MPRLAGTHQSGNAALAVAMLRHQAQVTLPPSAYRAAMGWADWPGRLQQLTSGPLVDMLPRGAELWIDGGHNPTGARCIADFFRAHLASGRPFHLIAGILANKDAGGILKPFGERQTTVHAVPVPDHAHHAPAALAAIAEAEGLNGMAASSPIDAIGWIARHADRTNPPVVLVLGSLYLAGAILAENGPLPD
jgi:dihydrofolate synthase/folylpolyglutamate synthase